MDVSKYMTGAYITAKDLGGEVRDETIADTRDGQYGKPELIFESKDKLTLNATNLKIMTKNYGRETNLWVGIMIRLVRARLRSTVTACPVSWSCRSVRPQYGPEAIAELARLATQAESEAARAESRAGIAARMLG